MLWKRKHFVCLHWDCECSVLLPAVFINSFLEGIQGFTCFAPRTTGTMHSGSVAWVLSSMRMERNCILASLGSPAPTQVQQITSAFWDREEAGISTGVSADRQGLGVAAPGPHHEQLPLRRALQRPVTLLISRGKFSSLILELLQLLKLWHAAKKPRNSASQPNHQLCRVAVKVIFN